MASDQREHKRGDRAATLDLFHQRLRQVISASGLSQTAFAARVGIDRSTLSQILSASGSRLPRVETLAQIAVAEQVSVDWLIGLSQEGSLGAGILEQTVEIQGDALTEADRLLAQWREEAVGYKIRYVPGNLPDLLKTPAVIDHEYRRADHSTAERQEEHRAGQLAVQRLPESDMEVCTSLQEVESFARGTGRWSKLGARSRQKQLEHMAHLCEELYPRFRWFMFDLAKRFSVPLTIFGPQRVVIYAGQRYLVLTGTEQIRQLTGHFDDLIRAASVEPTQVPELLRKLARS